MKTPQSIQQKIEYQSSVCLPYIGPASHKIERILRNEAGIKVYHSSENKLFRALCTHKDSVNESQKPGVYRSSNIEAVRALFVGLRRGGGGAEEGRRREGA